MGRRPRTFAPLQPSSLFRSTGPTSPASPLTPKHVRCPPLPSPRRSGTTTTATTAITERNFFAKDLPPINKPMPWIWSCHKCHSHYPLGATRRCLHDGHYFCGGITLDKYTGTVKKHTACGSEFDYIGWQDVGRWKAGLTTQTSFRLANQKKDCHRQCEFPSDCYWHKNYDMTSAGFNFQLVSPPIAASPPHSSVQNRTETNAKATENHLSQTTTMSSIERPPPKTPAPPTAPIMDFSTFKKSLDAHHHHPASTSPSPQSPLPPPFSTHTDAASPSSSSSSSSSDYYDDDVNMTDWITESPPSSSSSDIDDIDMTD